MSSHGPAPLSLPPGFRLVPLFASQAEATVRLAAVLRAPSGGEAALVPVRQLFDGRVVLGALVDHAGRVLSYLDLAVQSVRGLASAPTAAAGIDNAGLDRRWAADARALADADAEGAILTGFESEHPLPAFLDGATGEAIHPVDPASGGPLRLCIDDRDLEDAGLPPFTRSLHRYLRAGDTFVPVTDGAPTNDRTRTWGDVLGEGHGLVAFNPEAGLLRVGRHSPLDLETLLGRLSQRTPDPLPRGPRAFADHAAPATGNGSPSASHLFLSAGRSGRLVESLHLRLRVLADAVDQVARFTRQTQRPLLNLSDASFRVRAAEARPHLPLLWTVGLQLADGGVAVRLPLPEAVEAFVADAVSESVYRPRGGDRRVEGRAEVRLRQLLDRGESGQVIAEGTLVTDERLSPAGRDLLWVRLPLADRPLDVFAHLERDGAMPAREWRLRTLALPLDDAGVAALRELEGRPVQAPFALIPHLSSPADLYSLGVLGARLLLTGEDQALPVALDELLSLGESIVEAGVDELHTAAQRIAEALAREARYQQSLGPQRLSHAPLPFREALDLVPLELWSQTLAAILAMFPGRAGVSSCRSLSDAQPGALHRVHDPAAAALDRLLVLSRSLIVIDWRFNRELSGVLRRVEAKL